MLLSSYEDYNRSVMKLVNIDPTAIKHDLETHSGDEIVLGELWPSAVLVPVIQKDDNFYILFTVRTRDVEHHKGEVSFPGGARDDADKSLQDTALRETFEEVGIRQEDINVLGKLGDHKTPSGFHITPYVGFIPPSYKYDPSLIEVDQVLEVPIDFLWEIYKKGPQPITFRAGAKPVLAYEYIYEENRIWGATARILTEFFKIIEESST